MKTSEVEKVVMEMFNDHPVDGLRLSEREMLIARTAARRGYIEALSHVSAEFKKKVIDDLHLNFGRQG